MEYPSEKTKMQLRIERVVTNGRNYQTVPYTRVLGERRALKQWLRHSRLKIFNLVNSPCDKTALLEYKAMFGRDLRGLDLAEPFYQFIQSYMTRSRVEKRFLEGRVA